MFIKVWNLLFLCICVVLICANTSPVFAGFSSFGGGCRSSSSFSSSSFSRSSSFSSSSFSRPSTFGSSSKFNSPIRSMARNTQSTYNPSNARLSSSGRVHIPNSNVLMKSNRTAGVMRPTNVSHNYYYGSHSSSPTWMYWLGLAWLFNNSNHNSNRNDNAGGCFITTALH